MDLLPSGFELAEEGSPGAQGGTLKPRFVERREDRVLVFCEVSDTLQEYVYAIKATSAGDFAIPPAFAESMYDL
ncbi:MAG: hypothetical protein Q8M76_02015, partial [Spirochaetaceae bacterium]|nr:hypothetical protein [Spirochaetaceae bacterium]